MQVNLTHAWLVRAVASRSLSRTTSSVNGARAAVGRRSRRLSVVARTLQQDLSLLASDSQSSAGGGESAPKGRKTAEGRRREACAKSSAAATVHKIPARTRQMVHMVFVELDQDKDLRLNLKEMQELAIRVRPSHLRRLYVYLSASSTTNYMCHVFCVTLPWKIKLK